MIRRWARKLGRGAGTVGREIGWWFGGAGRLWWRHKIAATSYLAATALAWWQTQLALAAALAIPVLSVAGWARGWPMSYRRRLGDPLDRLRVVRKLRRDWSPLMESVDLARRQPTTTKKRRPDNDKGNSDRRELEVPRLRKVRWSHDQLVAWPTLLRGQTVDDVELTADRLRVALGAQRCRVVSDDDAATTCRIVWSFTDPLLAAFAATVPEVDAPLGCPDWVPMGRTEDGHVWELDTTGSTMVAGESGSGKASVIWGLMFALGPRNLAGLVELHGIDLKGGMEFSMGRAIFTRYAQTAETAVAMLEDDARNLQARALRLAGRTRQHTQCTDEPTVIIVIDELAALITYSVDRDLTRRAEAALALILSQGRAVGYLVFAFLQDPRKETVRMRHLFTQTMGLRLREREEVAMVLGDGAIRRGALCHKISRSTRGVGYVLGEDGNPVRVRAGLVTDDMIRLAAERFPAPRQVPIMLPADPEPSSPRRTSRSRASVRLVSEGEV